MAVTALNECHVISAPKADTFKKVWVDEWVTKDAVVVFPHTYDHPISLPNVARDKALAYVQEARAVVGAKRLDKLPRGRVGNGHECVLGRALPYCVSVNPSYARFKDSVIAAKVAQTWATTATGTEVKMPDALRDFVWHFDNRRYADLIA